MNGSFDPVIQRIGWTLIHSLWLLAIPAASFGVLLWLVPQKYCRVRYAVGIAALLVMALLPIVSAPFVRLATDGKASIGTNLGSAVSPIAEQSTIEAREAVGTDQRDPDVADNMVMEKNDDARSGVAVPNQAPAEAVVVVQSNRVESGSVADASPDRADAAATVAVEEPDTLTALRSFAFVKPILPWAVTGWIVGVALMSFRLLAGWRSTRRLKCSGIRPVPDATDSLFAELKQRIGGCKATRLVQSTLVSVPSIVGHFRPVVLLPVSALTGLSEEQLRAILAHELAHVKRYDYLVNICQTVVETLLFYHPAVWWVSRCVREEREHCCDDVALQHGCQASELAQALVTVDAIRPAKGQDLIDSTLIPAADGGSLLRRVRRLAGGTAHRQIVGRSWIAGGIALGLAAAVLLMSIASIEGIAQDSGTRASDAEETNYANEAESEPGDLPSGGSRIDFQDGFFVELVAIEGARYNPAGSATVYWNSAGSVIDQPFSGVQSEPLAYAKEQMTRQFYVRARMPGETTVELAVPGQEVSDTDANPSDATSGIELKASTIAILPKDQKSVDLTANLQLPAWRTVASFDFAGGVKNGIIMDWEQKVTPFARYTATGDFGPDATRDNVRILAFGQEHQRLDVAETSFETTEEGRMQLKAAFKIKDGRPWHVVVQRRIATRSIVFRDVPLSPGKHAGVRVEIPGVIDEPTNPSLKDSSLRPLHSLLAEPFGPLSVEIPGSGTIRLISVREVGSDSPGWHADGSPRLVPFSDEQLRLMRPTTDDRHRRLEAMFEFTASASDVRIGKISIRPEDGFGSTSRKPISDRQSGIPGVRLLQALNILDDRETEDFEVNVFAGPVSKLATLSINDPPPDYEDGQSLGYEPASGTSNVAFYRKEPTKTKIGWRHVVLLVLPDEAPEGAVLTGITAEGERIDGFTNFNRGRVLLGSFDCPSEERMQSVEVATQPRHSLVFRNVSVWSGLGSSAFVDWSDAAAIDFDSVTPSRVFLRPSGERIAEGDGVGVGISPALAALQEIERRGGLFRFDAEAEAPTGETLPYLTEIRWRDFRADELRWIRAIAGLTRLELSSEYTTDESLQSLEHLNTLTKIEISRADRLTTACLKSLGKLTDLRELNLYGRSLKWDDDDYNANDFRHLRGLTEIVEWEPQDWRIDDAGLAWLTNADDLEMVYGWGPAVTDEGFAALADKPSLGVIHLNATRISDRSYALLENHPKLYWLQCSSPNLTDAAIDSVITMSNLREVHLYESQVTDAGVQKLVDAIDQLPRLETVNLSKTTVSQAAVEKLRSARDGLRVLATSPSSDEKVEKAKPERASQIDKTLPLAGGSDAVAGGEGDIQSAPQDVPWPDQQWTKELPPSGSGIRVKLDDRRWVEFNSVYATQEIDGERTKIHWTADGELIDPPSDFDPKSLVPDRDGGEMPSVTRGFLLQVVGPTGTRFGLDTSGSGGWGNSDYPIDDSFVQIPVDTIASSIGYNHAYADVKVSQEIRESLSLEDDRFQTLTDTDEKKVFIVTENARDFAWRLMIKRNGEAADVEPFLVGGTVKNNTFLPDTLKAKLKEGFRDAQLLAFSFSKNQPMPELVSIERSPYDTVRFDNLSVYPGPRTAVVVSVNGVPTDEANRPNVVSPEGLGEDIDLARWFSDIEAVNAQEDRQPDKADIETVSLTGTVVDENGIGIRDCWVGLFIEPQIEEGQSPRVPPWAKQPLSAFGDGPPLTRETKTNALGQFTFEAPKTHFVFEGQFWAMRPDGSLGSKWMNAVWSHVQKPENLKLTIRDERADVRVINSIDKPVTNAIVTLRAIRNSRGVTQVVPEFVQRRLNTITNESGQVTFGGVSTAAIRGLTVSADKFGIQFLDHRLASNWVRDDQPLTIQLQSTADLAGEVIGFDSELDEGLQLQLLTESNDGRPPMRGQAITEVQPDGTFRFQDVAVGRVSLQSSLRPDSRRKVRFTYVPPLKGGETRRLEDDQNPQMVSAVVVRQRLIKSDSGKGIPDARLGVLWGDRRSDGRFQQSQMLKTDADGWWMARVMPGLVDVRLGTLPEGYRSTTWFDGRYGRGNITAMVPATEKLVTLPPERYVPAVEMTGKLQFADGSPAARWSVNGHPVSWDDLGLGAVRTDYDGSFTLIHPTGYPPRLFSASNRGWMSEYDVRDRYMVPEVVSSDPLVLQISEPKTREPN